MELENLMEKDDSPMAELEDYWSIQPRRTDMVMKWLNEPFLKEALERKSHTSLFSDRTLFWPDYLFYMW